MIFGVGYSLNLGKIGRYKAFDTQRYERQLKQYCKIHKLEIMNLEYDSQMNVRYLVKDMRPMKSNKENRKRIEDQILFKLFNL